jgi:outer membrane protein insertion porin family
MKYVLSLFALVGITMAASPLSAAASYEGMTIKKIEITVGKGKLAKEDPTIAPRLKIKEGLPFSQADFDEDLKMLAKEFDSIEPRIEAKGDELFIKLLIIPRPKIQKLTIIGNKQVKKSTLMKELDLKEGGYFDRTGFSKAFHKLKAYYVKHGYFESELGYTTKPNEDETAVDIEIQIKEGRAGKIEKFVFTHFTKKERTEILDRMLTKEYFFLTSWATGDGVLKPEMFRVDELAILNFLHNEGYADAKLDTKIHEIPGKERVIVEFIATKGQVYHIGRVSVEGSKLFPAADLEKKISLKTGEPFSQEKINESARTISEMYGRKGYVDVSVTPETKLDAEAHTYHVGFAIEEGTPYRVGIIKVLGNSRTDSSCILHESLLVPGEIFDATLLAKTEERLKNTGYFTQVNVYATKSKELSGSQANFRDVIIEVAENPTTAHFRAGVGFSTSQKVMGTLGLTENNFKSRGLLTLPTKGLRGLRGGGEFLSFDASIGTRMLSYTLSWSKPYFLDSPWTVGFDLNKTKNNFASADYTIQSYSGTIFADYPLNAFVKFGTHYRLNHSHITLHHIRHNERNHELIKESQNGGLISALGAEFVYDSRNHMYIPTNGLRSTLGAEYAGLGGDHTFAKAFYMNHYFYSLYKGGVFSFRGDLQYIKPFGATTREDVPLAERLYAGGENSIRGYVYNRVGPKFHDRKKTVRGGFSEVLLSAEFDQALFKRLDAFVFFDAGNVYWDQFCVGKLRAAYGFGLKIKIQENGPPLMIGLGYPINPEYKEDVKRFFLTFSTSF